ncbi:hypothetical protein BRD00_02070 [Halobacteriales archaeon QS_8_69_26]|nr:MAG: hypothetical protein BRD00_02070 [Halobacteriales archaeon QS_8_69_26]
MECDNCRSKVNDSTPRCPECGYHPRRALIASGLAYVVFGYVFVFGSFGILFVTWGTVGFVASMLGVLVGIGIVFYGLGIAFAGTRATVDDDLDGYLFPILH